MPEHEGVGEGPTFFLAGALERRFVAEGRSYARLAAEITKAHAQVTGRKPKVKFFVDRRKLKQICTGGKFVLNVTELEALDSYLEPHNLGLSSHPILTRTSILETLAKSEKVVFVLGLRDHGGRGGPGWELSYWDVTAMAELQRQVNRLSTTVQFDIRAVPYISRAQDAEATARTLEEVFGDKDTSLVILGSPGSNLACERALAPMLGLRPFESSLHRKPQPPFHFARPHEPGEFQSCVFVEPQDLRDFAPTVVLEVEQEHKWAFRLRDGVWKADPAGADPMKTYGVFCAQRRPKGQVWMVLAGLSGPGTLGAARLVREIDEPLSQPGPGVASQTLWAPVHAKSGVDDRGVPTIADSGFLARPEYWSPTGRS